MRGKYNIYAAIFPNGKLYIGQTTRRLRDRRKQHKNSIKRHSYPLYNAIKKYGWENIQWKVLFRTSSIEELNYVEKWYIDKFKTTNIANGYNLKSGGEGGKLHEKTKKKLSKIFSGENSTSAKIDWERVKCIRSEYLSYKPKFIDLANKYKISRRQVGRILRNEDWVDKDYNPPKFRKLLTKSDVRNIRQLSLEGRCRKEISDIYNISKDHVTKIVAGKIWANIQ